MFDENTNIDQYLMMRSILEGAKEAVPERVWEGVSAGLDKAVRTKVVALWWKRAGIGVAAAAAAVAAMLMVQPGDGSMDIVSASEEMIAVVEHPVRFPYPISRPGMDPDCCVHRFLQLLQIRVLFQRHPHTRRQKRRVSVKHHPG